MSIKLVIFSDYSCPFCYLGKGIVEKLKQSYEIEAEWVGYELHPETPPEGKLLRQVVANYDPARMVMNMNRAGAAYGIVFSPLEVAPNTRLALEAAEFARDAGLFGQAQERMLRAYFYEGENVGLKETLLRLLDEIGLDRQGLSEALDNGVYADRLRQGRELAKEYDVTALPTFIINGRDKIVGAKPYEQFARLLDEHVRP